MAAAGGPAGGAELIPSRPSCGRQPIDPHFYLRNRTLVGGTLGGYPLDEMIRIEQRTQADVVALIERGPFRPVTSRVIDFDDVPAAVGGPFRVGFCGEPPQKPTRNEHPNRRRAPPSPSA